MHNHYGKILYIMLNKEADREPLQVAWQKETEKPCRVEYLTNILKILTFSQKYMVTKIFICNFVNC